ncbi:MAG TPA: hypothetical protein VNJ07_14640 [Chitinophagales bacterium]|nr:hypothetical protein [Chitinophagales bacterium]
MKLYAAVIGIRDDSIYVDKSLQAQNIEQGRIQNSGNAPSFKIIPNIDRTFAAPLVSLAVAIAGSISISYYPIIMLAYQPWVSFHVVFHSYGKFFY